MLIKAYGYTSEYHGDYSELVYLRARQYSPGLGRFLTRDTWGGDANRPMSFNRWNYVGGNPVNLTDPSGNFPPLWCQSMSDKASYEKCVDDYYQIEPVNFYGEFVNTTQKLNHLGGFIQGEVGCFSGPTEYRAPGYIEGKGATFAYIVNHYSAFESVYDFASMEHSYFISTEGHGFSDSGIGVSVNQYVGLVWGFRTDRDINNDYGGTSEIFNLGPSVDAGVPVLGGAFGPGVALGINGFRSTTDPKVRGVNYYVSGSFGLDSIPGIDVGVGYINMEEFGARTSYKTSSSLKGFWGGSTDTVDRSALFSDIFTGAHNVWLDIDAPPIGLPTHLGYMGLRMQALVMANHYANVYDELH